MRAFQGDPTVVSGSASFDRTDALDVITLRSGAAIIDWTTIDTTGTGPIDFLPTGRAGEFRNDPSATANFTVLNRILPGNAGRPVVFNGTVRSRLAAADGTFARGGTVWFYSPGGIIAGASAIFDVGSLMLTANAVNVANGLTGADGSVALASPGGSQSLVQVTAGARLTAGSGANGAIILAGPRVSTAGSLTAGNAILLVAGEAATVNPGTGSVAVTSGTATPTTGQTILTTSGTLQAGRTIAVAGGRGGTAMADVSGTVSGGPLLIAAGRDVAGTTLAGTSAGTSATNLILRSGSYTATNAGATGAATASFAGDATVASLSMDGARGVTATIGNGVTLRSGGSISLTSAGGPVTLANGGTLTTPPSGALTLVSAADAVAVTGNPVSAGSITLDGATVSAGTLAATSGPLAITSRGAVTLTEGRGQSIAVRGGTVGISRLIAGTGTLAVNATQATLGTVYAGGALGVTASGPVTVDTANSRTSVALSSTGSSVTLGSASTQLDVQPPSASAAPTPADGGISLFAETGVTATGAVNARGPLIVSAGGTASFGGQTTGSTIDVTSADLAVGPNVLIGGDRTTLAQFTVRPGVRLFLGGSGANATAGSYVFTGAELARVRANQIVINGGIVSTDPNRAPDVSIGDFTLNRPANFIGDSSLIRVQTPGTLEIVGSAGFRNMQIPDRVEFIAGSLIKADAPTAIVSVTGATTTNPAGILALQADQIIVATPQAQRDLPLLDTVDQRTLRLGQTDGAETPGGYLSANRLLLRVGSRLYIQNSGGNVTENRAGFTVGQGGIQIDRLNSSIAPEVIINGRRVTADGTPDQTGRQLVPTVVPFASGSSANGCTVTGVFCSDTAALLDAFQVTFGATNGDTIDEQVDEEEREKAVFRPRVPALIELRGFTAPSAPPMIDTPVTGAGNDDLWVDNGTGPVAGNGLPGGK